MRRNTHPPVCRGDKKEKHHQKRNFLRFMWIEHMTFRYIESNDEFKKLQSDALPTELNPPVSCWGGGYHDSSGCTLKLRWVMVGWMEPAPQVSKFREKQGAKLETAQPDPRLEARMLRRKETY